MIAKSMKFLNLRSELYSENSKKRQMPEVIFTDFDKFNQSKLIKANLII